MSFSDGISLLGLFLTIVGLWLTISEAKKARKAAVSARDAAEQARQACLRASAINDLGGVISALGELKTLHRSGLIDILPRRYDALRQQIALLRAAQFLEAESHQRLLQGLVTKMAGIERLLDGGITEDAFLMQVPRLNSLITKSIESLQVVMAELTVQIGVA